MRGTSARDQHGSDDQIRLLAGFLDGQRAGELGADTSARHLVDVAHAGDVDVINGDVGAHAVSNASSAESGNATAEHRHSTVADTGATADEHAISAGRLHETVRTNLGCESAGNFRHRGQQRQRVIVHLDGLVGDRGDLALQELLGERTIRSQMQVGEEGQPLMHTVILVLDGLLHFQDELSVVPHLVDVVDDLCASVFVLVVRDPRTQACASLHQHLMPMTRQRMDARGRNGYAELIVLDLCGNTNTHTFCSFAVIAERILGGSAPVPIHNRSYASSHGIALVTSSASHDVLESMWYLPHLKIFYRLTVPVDLHGF